MMENPFSLGLLLVRRLYQGTFYLLHFLYSILVFLVGIFPGCKSLMIIFRGARYRSNRSTRALYIHPHLGQEKESWDTDGVTVIKAGVRPPLGLSGFILMSGFSPFTRALAATSLQTSTCWVSSTT